MRYLITGGAGLLGWWITKYVSIARNEIHATFHKSIPKLQEGVLWHRLDLSRNDSVNYVLEIVRPDVIIHAAAFTDVDGCEVDKENAYLVNYLGTKAITRAAYKYGAFLIYISTDYVFDGERGLYQESDIPNPINYYGLTKLLGETVVQSILPESSLVIRVSGLFGFSPSGKRNFGLATLESLLNGKKVNAFVDQFLSPTYVPWLAKVVANLSKERITGILHLAGQRLSRYQFALLLAEVVGVDSNLVEPVTMSMVKLVAKRPRDSSLLARRAEDFGVKVPDTKYWIQQFVKDYKTYRS